MQRMIAKPWFSIIGFFIIATIDKFVFGLLPVEIQLYLHDITDWFYVIFALLFIYSIVQNIIQAIKNRQSSSQDKELDRQREIEKKEIDMVRKSNEILLHLIQDEHREEDR